MAKFFLLHLLWKLQNSLLKQKYLTEPFLNLDIEKNIVGSERNSKDNSGSQKSTDEKFKSRLEVSFSEPKLNPAAEREKVESRFKN